MPVRVLPQSNTRSIHTVIEGFFFGPSHQQVFGSYHPPTGGDGRVLTVICPPLFNEFMRTQLALRDLAVSLAQRGQHVLRFDYRGTGDSFGDLEQIAVADWLHDIVMAVREGRELSGSSVVRLLAVRAGALLACRSEGASPHVERLVLWDPVCDGAEYLRSLRRMHVTLSERDLVLTADERAKTAHEYAGHRLSEPMVAELGSFDAAVYLQVPQDKLQIVHTAADAFPVAGILTHAARFDCNWDSNLADLLMPRTVLETLCRCLIAS